MPRLFPSLMLVTLACLPAQAQLLQMPAYERFELGRRVRAFEETWDDTKDAEARKRGAAKVAPVTNQFFSFQFGKAGETLDLSRLALLSDKDPSADSRWAESLTLKQTTQLLDASSAELPVSLQRFYTTKGELPDGLSARMFVTKVGDKPGKAALSVPVKEVPAALKVPVQGLKEGDYRLTLEIVQGDKVLARQENYPLSLIDKLAARLDKLLQAREALTDEQKKSLDANTAGHLQDLFKKLNAKQLQETGYPVTRLVTEAEQAVAAAAAGKSIYGNKQPGEFWLSLPAARGRAPVRLLAPDSVKKGEPLPLVIALHGAGGSENMFFDAYGNGGSVRQCRERGWLLAATRDGQGAEKLVEALTPLYPIDTKRIFIIGHSMGASQAMSLVAAQPKSFRAVALLGGGGRVRASEELKEVAAFVGVGSADRIGAGAKQLHKALKDAEVKELEWREYEGIDHLVIVQMALPDVFAFFEKHAKK